MCVHHACACTRRSEVNLWCCSSGIIYFGMGSLTGGCVDLAGWLANFQGSAFLYLSRAEMADTGHLAYCGNGSSWLHMSLLLSQTLIWSLVSQTVACGTWWALSNTRRHRSMALSMLKLLRALLSRKTLFQAPQTSETQELLAVNPPASVLHCNHSQLRLQQNHTARLLLGLRVGTTPLQSDQVLWRAGGLW